MRRTTPLTAAAALGLGLLAPTAPARAAGESCHGEAATIVGERSTVVNGTEGRDVVVTNGSPRVDTFGGDDLVCVTGKPVVSVTIDAGPGNDVVDARQSRNPVFGDLGAGADTFLGGPDGDRIELAYPDAGGGIDAVEGGAGHDQVQLQTGAGAAVIDNAAGSFTSAGTTLARWSGVEDFWVLTPPAPRDLTFVGSSRSDRLLHDSWDPSVVDVDLGGGDDEFETRTPPLDGSRLAGGDGTDLLGIASAGSPVGVDLKHGRLDVRLPAPYRVTVEGFEDAEVFAPEVLLAGTRGDNRLGVTACTGVVTGRSGDDVLVRQYDGTFETDLDCRESLVLEGDQGNDRFVGSGGDDTILGGPGRDVVNGRGGDDLVRGNGGADTITGQDGRDTIYGGGGKDKLEGGKGRDTVFGGQGRDVCRAERESSCEG